MLSLFLMIRRPPRSTRTDTLFPYTTLVRSSLRALSQKRLRHGDPKWSKTALSAGKRSDAVKAAFVIGERGAIRSLTRFDDMPDENDVIAGFEVMIAQTFQMGDAAFDQDRKSVV